MNNYNKKYQNQNFQIKILYKEYKIKNMVLLIKKQKNQKRRISYNNNR